MHLLLTLISGFGRLQLSPPYSPPNLHMKMAPFMLLSSPSQYDFHFGSFIANFLWEFFPSPLFFAGPVSKVEAFLMPGI